MTDSQPPKSTYHDAIQTEHNNSTEISDFKTSKEEYNLVYVTCWIIFYFHFLILMLRMDDGDYLFCIDQFFRNCRYLWSKGFIGGGRILYVMPFDQRKVCYFFSRNLLLHFLLQDPISLNSEVKPVCLDDDSDDDIERYSWSRIKTLNYVSCTELVRMVKVFRCC